MSKHDWYIFLALVIAVISALIASELATECKRLDSVDSDN